MTRISLLAELYNFTSYKKPLILIHPSIHFSYFSHIFLMHFNPLHSNDFLVRVIQGLTKVYQGMYYKNIQFRAFTFLFSIRTHSTILSIGASQAPFELQHWIGWRLRVAVRVGFLGLLRSRVLAIVQCQHLSLLYLDFWKYDEFNWH